MSTQKNRPADAGHDEDQDVRGTARTGTDRDSKHRPPGGTHRDSPQDEKRRERVTEDQPDRDPQSKDRTTQNRNTDKLNDPSRIDPTRETERKNDPTRINTDEDDDGPDHAGEKGRDRTSRNEGTRNL